LGIPGGQRGDLAQEQDASMREERGNDACREYGLVVVAVRGGERKLLRKWKEKRWMGRGWDCE